jgi:putative intracellular protease/amidase
MAVTQVVIVATSHSELGSSGERTGLWLEEMAVPYYALLDAGVVVLLASVHGGEIPLDPRSVRDADGPASDGQPTLPAAVRRFLGDGQAMETARSSITVASIADRQFDGVMLPGGHGTMWDMPGSAGLAQLVGSHFDRGRVVAAVCHGPAGLVAAKRQDGHPIVEGRKVNGFTNTEEESVGLAQVVPFLLESRLKELGGLFERGPDWQPYAVRDGNLITGQNPQSSDLVARHLLEALGLGAQAAAQ